MHPSVSQHLHSDECNILVAEYQKCNEEVYMKKYKINLRNVFKVVP